MFYRVYIHTDTTIHVTSHLDLFIFSRCHSNVQCVEHSFETWEGTMHVYLQPVYIYIYTYMCICYFSKVHIHVYMPLNEAVHIGLYMVLWCFL